MIAAVDDAVLDELRAIIGDPDRVLTNRSSRVVRTRVPAPFPGLRAPPGSPGRAPHHRSAHRPPPQLRDSRSAPSAVS